MSDRRRQQSFQRRYQLLKVTPGKLHKRAEPPGQRGGARWTLGVLASLADELVNRRQLY